MRKLVAFTLIGVGLGTAGCVRAISPEAKEQLAKPVECETAEQDIATLESEKASVAERIAAGVRTVQPAAAVVGIIRGDLSDRAQVAIGEYNRQIEDKIIEIKQKCGMWP